MSAKVRLLKRVVAVRQRMRDVAAAAAGTAEHAAHTAALAQDELAAEIAAQEAEATARFVAARGGHDLLAMHAEAARWRDAAKVAGERVAQARTASNAAQVVLAQRARELEKMERIRDAVRDTEAEEALRAEQKALDDLGAARVYAGAA